MFQICPLEITIHELAHAADFELNPCEAWLDAGTIVKYYETKAEEKVIKKQEQNAAHSFGLPKSQVTRTDHFGVLKRSNHWWPGDNDKSPKDRKPKAPNNNNNNNGNNNNSGSVQILIGDRMETYGGNK